MLRQVKWAKKRWEKLHTKLQVLAVALGILITAAGGFWAFDSTYARASTVKQQIDGIRYDNLLRQRRDLRKDIRELENKPHKTNRDVMDLKQMRDDLSDLEERIKKVEPKD